MRFKFKAWDTAKKEMRNVKLMDWSDWWISTGSTWERDEPLRFGERNSFNNEETDRHILLQFTGLTDSEGNEIYENDLIYDPINDNMFIVKWDESYAMYFMKNVSDSLDKPDYDFVEYDEEVCTSYYLVGNIYENPELLKQK